VENVGIGCSKQREHGPFDLYGLLASRCVRSAEGDDSAEDSVGNRFRWPVRASKVPVRMQGQFTTEDFGVKAKSISS
jgi:hypothetical protein